VRVVVAPDSFTGTLSAVEAADAIARGWRRTAPDDELVEVPLSDGGPGFVDVVHASLGGELQRCTVRGPVGARVDAGVLVVGSTAYVEVAQACGLHLVPADMRDPRRTTTAGVADLLEHALDAGARRIVVGLGGSGTTDAGAGMLGALGAKAYGADGADVSDRLLHGGGGLRGIARVDLGPARADLDGVRLVIASDVDVPLLGLRGAANGFARQKGADDAAVMELEGSLESFAAAVGRGHDGKDPAVALGAGAAGGLGYALLHLGATRVPGISTVLETVGLADRVAAADLVVTGEGCFDWQSLRGKVVAGVAEEAMAQGRGCVVLAGRVEVGRREYAATGVSGAYAVTDHLRDAGLDPGLALADPAEQLAALAARAARTWSR
jgi:glycerate 2-kinase